MNRLSRYKRLLVSLLLLCNISYVDISLTIIEKAESATHHYPLTSDRDFIQGTIIKGLAEISASSFLISGQMDNLGSLHRGMSTGAQGWPGRCHTVNTDDSRAGACRNNP